MIGAMQQEGVGVSRRGPVTIVTIDRPTALDALDAAHDRPSELAALPRRYLRNDRLSVIEHWDLARTAAANDARRGRTVVESGETAAGTARFARGAGPGDDG